MSMYNLLFNENGNSDAILATLGLSRHDFGRFRDCYVEGNQIAVYTRLGGGNREDYSETICMLRDHPLFKYDLDDTFDCTYATFYFSFPVEFAEDLKKIAMDEPFDPDKRWEKIFKALGG